MSTDGSARRTVDTWLTARRAVMASVISVVLVTLVAATPNSPFLPAQPIQAGPSGPLRLLAGFLLFTHLSNDTLVILLLPLLLSRDVFSYSYYGRIVSRYGGNPYVQTPASFPQDPLWRFTWPEWRTASSVYGPTFVWLAAAITAVFHSITAEIFGFKVTAIAAMLGSM